MRSFLRQQDLLTQNSPDLRELVVQISAICEEYGLAAHFIHYPVTNHLD